MPRAGGITYTRVPNMFRATHQLSVMIVSKGYTGSGLCIPSKNQNLPSSNSRRGSLKR